MKKPFAVALLAVWLLLFLAVPIIWLPREHPGRNLLPFRTIVREARTGGREFLSNIVGNMVVFIPVGILLPFTLSRPASIWRVGGTAALLSASIELVQYLSGRRLADIDDITLNTTGALLGFAARGYVLHAPSLFRREPR